MRTGPYTSMAAAPGTDFSGLANLMAMKGRGGDNTLVHMSKTELPYLNMLAKSSGHPQGLPVNPETGLPEANILKSILPVAGAILGGMFLPGVLPAFLGQGALATGVGAGLGSFGGNLLGGADLKDAAIGGLISGGLSGLGANLFGGQSFMGDTTSYTDPAAAALAGRQAAMQAPAINPAQAFGDIGGGANPLLTSANTNMVRLGAGDQLIPIGSRAPIDLTAGLRRALPTSSFESSLQIDPNIAGELSSPFVPATGPTPDVAINALGDVGGFGAATQAPTAVTNADYVKALQAKDLVGKDFGVGDLSEGFQATQSSLDAVQGMSKPSFLSFPKGYDPKLGLDRFDFLKTQLKPAATMGAVGIGADALLKRGAFEPIDYSSFPQAGEVKKPSPLPRKGLRFVSERTGAFPESEAEALAFAQPGGNRQRFFDQRFVTSAKTGGGIGNLPTNRVQFGKTAYQDTTDAETNTVGSGTLAPGELASIVAETVTPDLSNPADVSGATGRIADLALGTSVFAPAARAAGNIASAVTAPPGLLAGANINPFSLGVDILTGGLLGTSVEEAIAPGRAAHAMADTETAQGQQQQAEETKGTIDPLFADVESPAEEAEAANTAAAAAIAMADTEAAIGAQQDAQAAQAATDAANAAAQATANAAVAQAAQQAASVESGFGDFAGDPPDGAPTTGDSTPADSGIGAGESAGNPAGGTGADTDAADELKTGGLIQLQEGGTTNVSQFLQSILGDNPQLRSSLQQMGVSSLGQIPQGVASRAIDPSISGSPLEEEEMQNIAVMQQVLAGVPVEAQAGGLISAYAMGGAPSPYFEGRVMGEGDGMSDSISFSIEGQQPAILSRDEYVLPADIVSMMGNGSSDAGAEKIDSFINDFRVQKYGRSEQPPETRRGLRGVA